MPIPKVSEGQDLSAAHYNTIVERVNALEAISGVNGNLLAGQISPRAKTVLASGESVIVMATVTDSSQGATVKAFYPAGIEDVYTGGETTNMDSAQRVLQVEELSARHWGNWCIPLADGVPGQFIPVVISGVCLAKIDRDLDFEVLDRADIWVRSTDTAGETPLRASNTGKAKILWHKNAQTGEQWGVIRIEDAPPLRKYTNTHSTTIRHGDVLCFDPTDTDGVEATNKMLALQSPIDLGAAEAVSHLQWINQGGDVASGGIGVAVPGAAIGNVEASADADDMVGGENGTRELVADYAGYRVEAYLGSIDGVLRAAVRPFWHPSRIPVDLVNLIKDDVPNSAFAANGNIYRDIDGAVQHDVMLHFKWPVTRINAARFLQTTLIYLQYFIDGSVPDQLISGQIQLIADLVLDDWDATVTWNVASGFVTRKTVTNYVHMEFDTNVIDSSVYPSYAPDQVTATLKWKDDGSFADYVDYGQDGYSLTAADASAGRRIYGVRLSLYPVVYDGSSVVAQGVISNTVTVGLEKNWGIVL